MTVAFAPVCLLPLALRSIVLPDRHLPVRQGVTSAPERRR